MHTKLHHRSIALLTFAFARYIVELNQKKEGGRYEILNPFLL